jgi:hypothetical protein
MLQSCNNTELIGTDVEEGHLRVLSNYGWECWDMQKATVLSVISKSALRCNKADVQHAELADLRSDVFVSNAFN